MDMANERVLIVDDDPDVRIGLAIRLKSNNYETFFAEDTASTIAEAHNHLPDIIVLDLGLASCTGFEVMRKLAATPELARIPVVVVSARDRHANESRARAAGAKAFLAKPIDNETLLSTVRTVLDEFMIATIPFEES
jgi:twitching motility two-component system response regulator PilH